MPLVGFYCTDKVKITKEKCLNKCRLERRCLTLPTLMALSQTKEWMGKPSTTMLLAPYRISYLKIKGGYFIEPKDHAYSLLGIKHHSKLELFAKIANLLSEFKLDGEVTGTLDLLEPDGNSFILSDYKTWGSYQVKKWLENGDKKETSLQLNHYRVKVESDKTLRELLKREIKVSRIQLQVTIRDGGTWISKDRGVEDKILILDVPFIEDDVVTKYFGERSVKLLGYLNDNKLPPVCDKEENWNWKRCKTCDVWESCPEGAKINARKLQ